MNDTQVTLSDIGIRNLSILNSLNLIENAWTQDTYEAMNSEKKWPEAVPGRDFEGLQHETALTDAENIALDMILHGSIGKFIRLEVETVEINELVEGHFA